MKQKKLGRKSNFKINWIQISILLWLFTETTSLTIFLIYKPSDLQASIYKLSILNRKQDEFYEIPTPFYSLYSFALFM
jgi:hypothetical protein